MDEKGDKKFDGEGTEMTLCVLTAPRGGGRGGVWATGARLGGVGDFKQEEGIMKSVVGWG